DDDDSRITCVETQCNHACEQLYYFDSDRDGFGSNVAGGLCEDPGPGFATSSGDCDDGNEKVNPQASEECDGVDDDCNGAVDDKVAYVPYYYDGDVDGAGG